MKNPIPSFLHLFLRRAGIRIDELRIRASYERHPMPHSIRALSDTLDRLHVPTRVCRPTFGQLPEFERPFIVTAGTDEYPFFSVEKLNVPESTVTVRSVSGHRSELSFERFQALWTGTVLTAKRDEAIQENPVVYFFRQSAARIVGMPAPDPETLRLRTRHERLLSSPETFRQLLALQPPLADDDTEVITVSNYSESDHTLALAIDPASSGCAEALKTIARLGACRIELIFTTDPDDRKSYNAALRMISSGIRDSWETTFRIISDWYRKRTLPPELDIHPLAQHDLESQMEFCRRNKIATTPTLLVDNRRLPEIYDIADLEYLL
ncbi:MAG: hypothetical protein K2G66_02325, partial [Alistipes sp.]|nr:hypothetical protein [Alistipes sp.]MDE5906452.1 hypothetical protein [Alistipes sp.]